MSAEALYTQTQMEAMISAAVKAALASVPHLDNHIDTAVASEEENEMPSKVQHKITLSNGEVYNLRGNTLSEAIESLLDKLIKRKKETPVFRDYTREWQELYHDPKSGDRWKRETKIILEKHIMPFFADMRIGDIDVSVLQKFFNTKKDLSESTNKHIKYVLSGILQSAVEDEYIEKDYTRSKRLTISRKKTVRTALELEDAQDIISNMERLPEPYQLLLALLMYTGMRRGELLALRWQDVDIENNVIHVTHAVNFYDGNTPKLKSPKSKAGTRDIPITGTLMPYLKHQGKPNEFLIGGKNEPITAHAYLWMFDQLRKKIDLHGATAHVLRHTFATLSSEHIDMKTLQTIMGHSKSSTTADIYTHAQKRLVKSAGEKLSEMYEVNPSNPD